MINLNWQHIKQVLSDKIALGLYLLLIFMVVYLAITSVAHRRIKVFLLCAALFLIVFFVKKISQVLLWYIFLAILLSDLACDYFVRANHHFLLIYMTVAVIVYLHNSRLDLFVLNIKYLVVIVLFFSGLQKVLSPEFITGDLYYLMINTGGFFKPILYYNPEMIDTIISNKALIAELGTTNPNLLETVTLKPIVPHLDVISFILSWMTIIMELVAAVLILWKPKHIATHIVFILLIMGIFFTRYENGFLALLAISGVWLSEHLRIRIIYTVLAIICFSFILTKIGFH